MQSDHDAVICSIRVGKGKGSRAHGSNERPADREGRNREKRIPKHWTPEMFVAASDAAASALRDRSVPNEPRCRIIAARSAAIEAV
eukprot:9804864-Alexandrium_andersonii.AAC.1